jgi:hypothetical protein
LECCRAAKLYLLEKAQKGVKGAKMLSTGMLTEENVLRMSRNLIVAGSRVKNQIPRFYGAPFLAVLNHGYTLGKMCMKRANEMVQKRISSTLHWSIQHIWIIEGKNAVRVDYMECKFKMKKYLEQKIEPLPDHQLSPGPIFQSVAIDLFAPIEYQGISKQETDRKRMGSHDHVHI